jgi:hypothetical protein
LLDVPRQVHGDRNRRSIRPDHATGLGSDQVADYVDPGEEGRSIREWNLGHGGEQVPVPAREEPEAMLRRQLDAARLGTAAERLAADGHATLVDRDLESALHELVRSGQTADTRSNNSNLLLHGVPLPGAT